eukprot:CAMPEP_0170492442 /NCGR_PEP_ID=MMETSP0208-20121228/12256_1 /TAXON_ID=197538 /ORGANISM="Strombidium inclinatum, Strain S3" /LENGTH=128 /DNA_ID=CAMNT_0010768177 /DNA_START=23 /DNA_END=406 /DNA_ORIENTATION=+
MSLALVATLATDASARRHHFKGVEFIGGIDEKEIMQEQGSHWRKPWPEGDTDAGDGDDVVLNLKGKPRKVKPAPPVVTYPWTLDEDVVSTQDSISDVEGGMGSQFSKQGWWDRGFAILNSGEKAIKSN